MPGSVAIVTQPENGTVTVDPVTGEGPWDDENFSASLDEVSWKLDQLELERVA